MKARHQGGLSLFSKSRNALMETKVIFMPQGVCSRCIEVCGENGVLTRVNFMGGCHGNLQGIAKLVQGMRYEDVVQRLQGIECGNKPTSCPDQLARAVQELMRKEGL